MADCLQGDCLNLKRNHVAAAKETPAYTELLTIFERLIDVTEASIEQIRPYLKPVPVSPYIEEKFREGLPLVDKKNFPVPASAFDSLLDTFLNGLAGVGNTMDQDIQTIKVKRNENLFSSQHLIDQFVMGHEAFIKAVFDIPDINNHLLFFVLRHIFKICLLPFQDILSDELARGWEKGQCPVCGFLPDMGVLRGEGGKLYLHCAICGHEWRFKRMACAFCGSDLQKELHYLEVEGDDIHKIYLCHLCKRYLKITDERNLPENSPLFLDLEELTTLHLDIIADQRGYTPGINL